MSLTLPQAAMIVEVSLRKGRETGCAPLAVAVLDAGGHLKCFAREDGAGIIRPQIAIGKAWGALGMGLGSRTLARRVSEQPQQMAFFGALNAMSEGRVVPAPGGVLIRDAGGAMCPTRTKPARWPASKPPSSRPIPAPELGSRPSAARRGDQTTSSGSTVAKSTLG